LYNTEFPWYPDSIGLELDLLSSENILPNSSRILNFEQISIIGTASSDKISGGHFADNIDGSRGSDVLNGRGGDDVLSGGIGRDTLVGGSGDDDLHGGEQGDMLDGGEGGDRMAGGSGNDTYIVDDEGDVVVENGGRRDHVRTSLSDYVLPDSVENLTFTGDSAARGIGNSAANQIIGTVKGDHLSGLAGADRLTGGLGKDILIGGGGADIFVFAAADSRPGGSVRDVIQDFERGVDRIDLASVGDISFSEQVSVKYVGSGLIVTVDANDNGFDYSDLAIQMKGVFNVDRTDFILSDDRVVAGESRDMLQGRERSDIFVFKAGDSGADWTDRDIIYDFASGKDMIDLSALGASADFIIDGSTLKIDADGDGLREMHIRFVNGQVAFDDILL
jgi:Ca2+-binding RTX toxin-like protein